MELQDLTDDMLLRLSRFVLICRCQITFQTPVGKYQYEKNSANMSVKGKGAHMEREDMKGMTELGGERWADPVLAGDSGVPVCLRGLPVSSRGRWLCAWRKDFSEVDTGAGADRNNNTAWQSDARAAKALTLAFLCYLAFLALQATNITNPVLKLMLTRLAAEIYSGFIYFCLTFC